MHSACWAKRRDWNFCLTIRHLTHNESIVIRIHTSRHTYQRDLAWQILRAGQYAWALPCENARCRTWSSGAASPPERLVGNERKATWTHAIRMQSLINTHVSSPKSLRAWVRVLCSRFRSPRNFTCSNFTFRPPKGFSKLSWKFERYFFEIVVARIPRHSELLSIQHIETGISAWLQTALHSHNSQGLWS